MFVKCFCLYMGGVERVNHTIAIKKINKPSKAVTH